MNETSLSLLPSPLNRLYEAVYNFLELEKTHKDFHFQINKIENEKKI